MSTSYMYESEMICSAFPTTNPVWMQNRFIAWYTEIFQYQPMYTDMKMCTEGSPYHRESTTQNHTDMVVQQYLMRADNARYAWLLGALACAFHDVGKLHSITHKTNKQGISYITFAGHELRSARMWVDYAKNHFAMLSKLFDLTLQDIYYIGWMIEYHLPWTIKNLYKRSQLIHTVMNGPGSDIYTAMLYADQYGRISDEGKCDKTQVHEWCNNFQDEVNTFGPDLPVSTKILYMSIGVSGSGKTTYRNQLLETQPQIQVFSMDDLRVEWYPTANNYHEAFVQSCNDKTFNQRSFAYFNELIKQGHSVYCDNLNISKKQRHRFITTARQHGYSIVAILFLVSINELMERQRKRDSKDQRINTEREILEMVERQFYSLHLPSYTEFDEIIIKD